MGSKRPFSDVDGSIPQKDAVNKKRKQQFKSHYRSNDSGPPKLGQSLNEVKKRARNIERRFAKGDNLPADVQQRLERELVQCKRQISDLQHKKKRQEMISKYHKVRFFERQKAERLRKQLKKQLDQATDPEETARLKADFHIADVDYHYTKFFPFLERYESLYSAEKSKEDSDGQNIAMRALHSPRPPMWKVVESALGEGQAALVALQERRSDGSKPEEGPTEARENVPTKHSAGGTSKKGPETVQNTPGRLRGKNAKMGMEQEGQQDDAANDSDGSGFFG